MAASAADGFSAEVRAWLTECLPRAVAYTRSLVRDWSEADDVVQECLYRLLHRASKYDLPRNGTRLLIRVITNECRNRATRGPTVLSLDVRDEADRPLAATLADPHAKQPVQVVLTDELRQVLNEALEQLPLEQRAALEMKSLGHSLDEIATALSVTANHAGVLVHRAKQALRRKLAAY
jgi:RNA polymerase sigma-70 factor (ECF subfamily)